MSYLQLFSILGLGIVLNVAGAFAQERPPILPMNLSYLRIDFIQPAARPAGLGGAFLGAAQDESAAPINPAGLTYLRGISVSINERRSRISFKEHEGSPDNPDAMRKFHTNQFEQAMASVSLRYKKFTFALFRQLLIDSRFDFETRQFLTRHTDPAPHFVLGGLGNFPGRRMTVDIELVHNGFSAAYEFSKRLSFGMSGKTSVLNFKYNEQTFLDPGVAEGKHVGPNLPQNTYSITSLDEQKSESRLKEPSLSFGLMAKLIGEKLFAGVVYNFNPTFTLKPRTFLPEYKLANTTLAAVDTSSAMTFSVPDFYGFGLYYIADEHASFTFDVIHIGYSKLLSRNSLNVAADDSLVGYQDPDGNPDLTLDDALEFHLGMELHYKIPRVLFIPSPGFITFRFGCYTKPGHRIHATANDENLERLYPEEKDQVHFTTGLGFTIGGSLKLDGSLDLSGDGFELIISTILTAPY